MEVQVMLDEEVVNYLRENNLLKKKNVEKIIDQYFTKNNDKKEVDDVFNELINFDYTKLSNDEINDIINILNDYKKILLNSNGVVRHKKRKRITFRPTDKLLKKLPQEDINSKTINYILNL